MVGAALEDPTADWVKIATEHPIEAGEIGPSLDAIDHNEDVHICRKAEPSKDPAMQEVVRKTLETLLAIILKRGNPLIALEAIAFACGFSQRKGETIPSIAKKHGISKQAFSRHVKEAASALGLPLRLPGRSEEASVNMSLGNKRNAKISFDQ